MTYKQLLLKTLESVDGDMREAIMEMNHNLNRPPFEETTEDEAKGIIETLKEYQDKNYEIQGETIRHLNLELEPDVIPLKIINIKPEYHIHNFIMFAYDRPAGWLSKAFADSPTPIRYLQGKFDEQYNKHGSASAMFKFFNELGDNDRKLLIDWVNTNYCAWRHYNQKQ